MRVLLDACVWGGAKAKLASAGLDIVWVGDCKEDPGDDKVIARALAENRVVVTLDKDFGELAIVHGTSLRHHTACWHPGATSGRVRACRATALRN